MPLVDIIISFDDMNVSARVGATAYYSFAPTTFSTMSTTNEWTALQNTKKLGSIIEVGESTITVRYDDLLVTSVPSGAFISFAKDKKVNTTSLLGYYMEVKFENDSNGKVELFSIGSEVAESSK